MYFWKIDNLKDDLTKAPLSEKDVLEYLVASIVVIGVEPIMSVFLEKNLWDILSIIAGTVIMVIGTVYIYRCNGGNSGKYFLQRYFSLGWVLGVRFMVLAVLLFTLAFYFILGFLWEVPEQTTVFDVIFLNILFVWYFWLLGRHIKDVAQK